MGDAREPLATRRDTAEYLGVCLRTLDNWRAQGTGPPAYRLGWAVRYRLAEVDRWLEEQREAGHPVGASS